MKTRIYLIRHAKSQGNLERRFQGRDDSPLSDLGVKQAELLKERFAREKIDLAYCSTLMRSRKTAQIVFGSHKIMIIGSPSFLERDFGPLDGKTMEEAKAICPEAEDFYKGRIADIAVKGIESSKSLQERSFMALNELALLNKGKSVAVIGHLSWIKSILSKLSNTSFEETMLRTRIPNCSITTLEAELVNGFPEFSVLETGNINHLK